MLSLPVTRTFYACMGTADTTVDCWHIYMGTSDRLLFSADIYTCIQQTCTVDCWHVYMGTADERLLSTADIRTWIQQTCYCWLLTHVHGHSQWQATVDCWWVCIPQVEKPNMVWYGLFLYTLRWHNPVVLLNTKNISVSQHNIISIILHV